MTMPPHLVEEDGELRLDVAIEGRRRTLRLTDRAEGFLREAGYAPSDVVPRVTARALVIVGGATLPEGNDARRAAWTMGGTDGGALAARADLAALADYLRGVTVEERVYETLVEHVRESGLSRHLDLADLRRRSDTVAGLRDIARDL